MQASNLSAQRIPLKKIKNKIYDFGFGYQVLLPDGIAAPMRKMDGMSALMGARFFGNKLMMGIEAGISNQPTYSVIKQWPMANQMALASVSNSTQINNWGAIFCYYLRDDKILNYYITSGVGKLESKSDLWVTDANFEDNCEIVDNRELIRSNGVYGSFGAGFSLSTYYFLMDEDEQDLCSFKIDFSCRYFFSESMKLLNVRSSQHGNHNNYQPYSLQFKDLATNTIHSHDVGNIIAGPVSGFQFNASIVFSGILSKLKLKKD
jgi:hypothetical protein